MKNLIKIFATAFLFFVVSLSANAQTYISGFISANTKWTLAGSPYIVNGNTILSSGYTLTIDSGVTVQFDSAKALLIDGQLIAIGTTQSRIAFTSSKVNPSMGDWSAISFSNLSVKAVFDVNGSYQSGCIMKYCDVLYGGNSKDSGAIHIESGSPYFTHCNIAYSGKHGIYCNGSTYVIDSSIVNYCMGSGLNYFCPSKVVADTIENNLRGGLYCKFGAGNVLIKGNYFYSNHYESSLSFSGNHLKIIDNYFINDSIFSTNSSGLADIRGDTVLIQGNSFINNNSTINILNVSGLGDTIECNLFQNNELNNANASALNFQSCCYSSNTVIQNNIFDGNINNSPYGVTATNVQSSTETSTLQFVNNTIKNNKSISGTCSQFYMQFAGYKPQIIVHNNNFINNTVANVINFKTSGQPVSGYTFLYFKFNSFLDSNATYEFNNTVAFGVSNIYVDSNYWGGSNTQHVDSSIYDFFDNSSLSVVYYQPVLTSPVVVDTICPTSFPTIIISEKTNEIHPFPNPFSTYSTITFKEELKDASLLIYNIFGQKVKALEHINANSIRVDRANLVSGIYIYEVVEKQRRIANGKLVVE